MPKDQLLKPQFAIEYFHEVANRYETEQRRRNGNVLNTNIFLPITILTIIMMIPPKFSPASYFLIAFGAIILCITNFHYRSPRRIIAAIASHIVAPQALWEVVEPNLAHLDPQVLRSEQLVSIVFVDLKWFQIALADHIFGKRHWMRYYLNRYSTITMPREYHDASRNQYARELDELFIPALRHNLAK